MLVDALNFYAEENHFMPSNPDEWDSVSGEPTNFLENCTDSGEGLATVEDGSVAKFAVAASAESVAAYKQQVIDEALGEPVAWNSGYKSAYDKGFAAGKLEQWNEFAAKEPVGEVIKPSVHSLAVDLIAPHKREFVFGKLRDSTFWVLEYHLIRRPERK